MKIFLIRNNKARSILDGKSWDHRFRQLSMPSLQPITTYVELFTSMFLQQIHDAEMQTLQQGY